MPQIGTLHVVTEFGRMRVEPLEICTGKRRREATRRYSSVRRHFLVPQGVRFAIHVTEASRGYGERLHAVAKIVALSLFENGA